MINKVTLIGNLGADPEVRRLESGAVVAKLRIATNENYKDKEGNWQTMTEWHQVVVWRNLAETAEKWFKKGMLIYVEGKLTHRKYTAPDGQEKYITEVVANMARNLSRTSEGSSGAGGFPSETSAPPVANNNASTAAANSMPAQDAGDDGGDLPF